MPAFDSTRRAWIAGALLLVGLRAAADEPKAKPDSADAEVEAVRARLAKAGVKKVRSSASAHYVAVGDAPDAFRRGALDLVEKLATDFQEHYEGLGFDVQLPKSRMTLVTLSGRKAFAALNGKPVDESDGGFYEVDTDRLVVFDSGNDKVNTFTLVHEAIHQLTYNAGLFDRAADVPVALSEGFAENAETWQLRNPKMGRENRLRLAVLKNPPGGGEPWIPIDTLLTDDSVFQNAATAQLAYAEAWLLVHHLLRTKAGQKSFRTYLDRVRTRKDARSRLADAEATLGNLLKLDNALKKLGNNLR